MNAIHATWRNGQIIPEESANWPEGVKLLVSPVESSFRPDKRGMTEDEQGDTLEQIDRWIAETDAIPPLVLTPDEEDDLFAWRERTKRFNLEAMREQMEGESLP